MSTKKAKKSGVESALDELEVAYNRFQRVYDKALNDLERRFEAIDACLSELRYQFAKEKEECCEEKKGGE